MTTRSQILLERELSFKSVGTQKEIAHMRSEFHIASRARFVVAAVLALVASVVFVHSASAAPSLSVELTHSPLSIPRNFESLNYFVKVKNDASSNPSAGDEVTCDPSASSWFQSPSFTYQWIRDGVSLGSGNGAQTSTYTVQGGDAGHVLQCVVLGTNAGGAAISFSNPIVVNPVPAPAPPSWEVSANPRPTVAGTGNNQRTCTAPTTWAGSPSFAFQWLRNGVPIGGATAATYLPQISATGTGERTAGSNQVTGVVTTTGTFEVGQRISAAGIPSGTTITEVNGTTLTISANATTTSSTALSAGPDAGTNLQCQVIGTNAGGAALAVSNNSVVQTPSPTVPNNNTGSRPGLGLSNATTGPITVEVLLPEGMETQATEVLNGVEPGPSFTCTQFEPSLGQRAKVICSSSESLGPQASFKTVEVRTRLGADAAEPAAASATVSGGGSPPDIATDVMNWEPPLPFAIMTLDARAKGPSGADYTRAGGHPTSGEVSFTLQNKRGTVAIESPRTIATDLPPGFIGNPQAPSELCDSSDEILFDLVAAPTCPRSSVVGGATVELPFGFNASSPVYAMRPERGVPAQFAFAVKLNKAVYTLSARLRPEDGYAISVDAPKGPQIGLAAAKVILCSYGANLVQGPPGGLEEEIGLVSCMNPTDAGAGQIPLLTNPTRCSEEGDETRLSIDTWQRPGRERADGSPDLSDPAWHTTTTKVPPITDCEHVPFTPSVDLKPTSQEADSPTGLDVSIEFPADGLESAGGISQAHLKKATVVLPKGMALNPAAADGLDACSQSELGMSGGVPNSESVRCPQASKIGSGVVTTPILDETLTGSVYVAEQGDNPFGTLLSLYLVFESKERGILIKLPGKITADPVTGQLVTTFDNNPQAPIGSIDLHFNGGGRAPLLTPPTCGSYDIVSELSSWAAADPDSPTPGEITQVSSSFEVTSGPGGGPCPNGSLDPKLNAGVVDPIAGSKSPFVLSLSRDDGSQRFSGLGVTLPPGLTAYLKGVPYCPDAALAGISGAEGTGAAEVASPSCPAASQIGTLSVGVGGGSPFYVNTGKAYLAGPYKGAPLSIAIVAPAVAGPFDLGSVVVRSAAYVNPKTAQITVKSDPIPTILHGIPLDVRDLRVRMDRPGFILAPTNCEAMAIGADVQGETGGSTPVSNRFQVGDCGNLGFKPNLKLKLKGGTKRNKYQQVTATLTARDGDANIAGASVRFPQSIFLAQEHIRTVCTRVQFAADSCPAGSIYGEAEAVTPLLDQPLKGPVYLRSSDNVLPDLVAALRGPDHQPIEVELAGRTDSKNRGIRNTFDVVPDAPVSKFTLRMMGGKKSLLVSSRDLCLRKERAVVKMRGQNGMVRNLRPIVQVNCKKKQKKAQRSKKSR